MTKYIVGVFVIRMVLPMSLLISMVLRPFGLSFIYLLCFLICPLIAIPKKVGKKHWWWYQCLIVISCLLLMAHIGFHIVLTSFPPYGSILNLYAQIKSILQDLGLVSYENIDALKAVVLLCPELIMATISIVVYVVAFKSMPDNAEDREQLIKQDKFQSHPFLIATGKYLALFLILLCGIIKPSVINGVYFLVFLGTATAWAVGRPLGRCFAVVARILMVLMAWHMLVLFVYQFDAVSKLLPPESPWARYFGLTPLVVHLPNQTAIFKYQASTDHKWTNVFSPLIILITYYLLALETRQLFKPKRKKVGQSSPEVDKQNGSLVRGVSFRGLHATNKDRWLDATKKVYVAIPYISLKKLRERDGSAADTVPLLRKQHTSDMASKISSRSSPHLAQSSTGSVIVLDLTARTTSVDELTKLTFKEEVILTIMELFQILIRSSYIPTTITMMAWSIMFHSWLGFVFLMWANIVWLREDQRSFMLKTSPVLVCYACMLLMLHYIYGIDLTESELPSNITAVNLRQIGISRPEGEPFVPLLIRCLFTCVFWVTLRQFVQERRERSQARAAAADEPQLALSMSTVVNTIEAKGEKLDHGHHLQVLGKYLRFMCARYWIYVVVIMLFVIGITGERMTIFRITYMALFLWFILMFQISWYWWRRLLYAFWITVIIYSMTNLILIYVYQFDNFSKLIERYLLINQRLQNDLGLEPYLPADLFIKLLTPTLFLIMTIMQVHYFHKDFLAISDPVARRSRDAEWSGRSSSRRGGSRRSQGAASTIKDDIPQLPNEEELSKIEDRKSTTDKTSLSSMATAKKKSSVTDRPSTRMRSYIWKFYERAKLKIQGYTNLVFLYIEIHFIKIIFMSIMLLCVLNVCAMHVPVMIIISPALICRHRKQSYIILFISTLISVYLMAKMIYQIEYIRHSYFDVNCTTPDAMGTLNTTTYNNAEWMGFSKASREKPLVVMLKGYIGLIAAFTFYSLVQYRQQNYRQQGLIPENPEKVIFTDVTRAEADKDVIHCLKYLINYGYYKFGVEVTLICLLAVIGSRMDVYAVLYSIWLFVLVCLRRKSQAKVWPFFTAFITLLVPIQYMLAVGFLPQFCVEYPWEGQDQKMKRLRNWLFLPYAAQPPYAMKLIFDYILLIFASRQIRAFRIEKLFGGTYAGGSNEENIGNNWESPNFTNPIPDFLGLVGSWLDVIKRLVFLGMLWLTLAIMFLTGTNRVNLFSMGYLIGSFIFLWQGTDFYLRPKKVILQWWSWLLYYNVSVVVIKALLQIPGCIFSSILQAKACWLVQLLGIGCVDKFAGGNIAKFIKMQYVKEAACSVPQEDIGLAWDGVCFAFLIVQRRLFHSYYFFRVIDESKATTMLASRGAELIEELRQKQMTIQEEQEVRILEKIKIKMERIKANQRKIHGFMAKEPPQHDAEDDDEEDVDGEYTQPEDTQPEDTQSERVPLVRTDTAGSGRGYHTPESPASPKGFHTPVSESSAPASPSHTSRPVEVHFPALPAIPPPTSSQGGPPSPSSALMTHSLEGYLEPRRISFESPPSSELNPRGQSPEESYPVFSPPPIRRRHTVASPSPMQRTSVISVSSRSEPKSHQTSVRSGDYYMFDEFDDTEVHIKDQRDDEDEELDEEYRMGIGKLLVKVFGSGGERAEPGALRRRASAPPAPHARHVLEPHASSEPQQRRPSSSPKGQRSQSTVSRDSQTQRRSSIAMESYAESEIEGKDTWVDKVLRILQVALAFVNTFMISMAYYLLKLSRDYRYVSRALSVEKRILKEKKGFGIGIREGAHKIWEPLPDAIASIRNRKLSDISVPEIRILAPSMERGLDETPIHHALATPDKLTDKSDDLSDDDTTSEHESVFSLQTIESRDPSMLGQEEDSMFKHHKSAFVHLCYALWYAVVAHTDIVCYLMVFVNQIQSATILSIPLPLMVFLWGTLTIPRPTKTFWVTLIAYTEVIVLIKSMFQFEILPWNEKVIPANMPFTAPRIIGIERKTNYALYDLLLLLIIFLHRFMLKSLGLWKETTPEIEIREDSNYIPTKEDTQMIMEGKSEEVGKKYLELHAASGPYSPPNRYIVQCSDSDSNHHLADRYYFVQAAMKMAAKELKSTMTTISDPRIAHSVTKNLKMMRQTKDVTVLRKIIVEYHKHLRKMQKVPRQLQSTSQMSSEFDPDDPGEGPSKRASAKDQEPIISVTTTLEDARPHYPRIIYLSTKRYLRPCHQFFKRILAPGARVTADIYAYMFLCDFFNFLVVIFGFAAFGTHQGDGGVQTYLEENKVPIPFLVMLILQFCLIVIDRALYLRKFILGKILFQYALIIGVHVWMFFVLPFITERTFNALLPPPMWYMVKCIYLLLSAYQIRCGYPRRIIGNFLCKSYHFINMLLFRGFMAVPFLFELRTLMDWIWTDTSMTLLDWLKMEDIFASVYLLKCSRQMEDEFPQPRGSKKANSSKYLLGGSVLAFVIAIIWFPLVFFAFGNTVGQPNPPTDVTVKIRIGPFLPVYQMSAQSHNIDIFTENDYNQLSNLYARDRTAQTFLSNYMYNDIAVIYINPNSTMTWEISPPELERLEREAASNATLKVKFTYVITHPSNAAQNPPTMEASREQSLLAYIDGRKNPERDNLRDLLANNASLDTWINVKLLFPKFVKVFNKGQAKPASQLTPHTATSEMPDITEEQKLYRDVQLRLERSGGTMYWRVHETCNQREAFAAIPYNNCGMLVMYTFNDKLFPETLNFISGSGIIGLYTTFVFLAARVLRGFFSGIYTKIMFDDLPNVDRVLQLCLDIYLVREAIELSLEEDLFAKLVFLYRSPETMIKWSRPKEDEGEQRALPPSR